MTTTGVEEKIKNAEDLFQHYYFTQGKENIRIGGSVLEESGLGGKVFWDIVCPALKKKGALKSYSYSTARDLDVPKDYANPQRAQELMDAIKYTEGRLDDLYKKNIYWDCDVILPGGVGAPGLGGGNQILEKRIRETKGELKELVEKHNSLERVHSFELNAEYFKQRDAGSKTKFENGVLRCGNIIHSFQRGSRGEKIRISFFRKLWDEKRLVKNGVEKIQGTPRAPLYFAVQLNLTTDSETFACNKKPKNQLFGLIKGINRILKQKGFPARIERKGGIQLVVTEK